jgi:hypothetical protein
MSRKKSPSLDGLSFEFLTLGQGFNLYRNSMVLTPNMPNIASAIVIARSIASSLFSYFAATVKIENVSAVLHRACIIVRM